MPSSLLLASGPMHLHDYATPGNYSLEIETERVRIRLLTLHAHQIVRGECKANTTAMNDKLELTKTQEVFTRPSVRMFSADKFELVGRPPRALKPTAMRKQVFVYNEGSVWSCDNSRLLHWLDEGYYVKEMRIIGEGRYYVRFANSWIDTQFLREHKTYMYED
jgi:hypothetical protein